MAIKKSVYFILSTNQPHPHDVIPLPGWLATSEGSDETYRFNDTIPTIALIN